MASDTLIDGDDVHQGPVAFLQWATSTSSWPGPGAQWVQTQWPTSGAGSARARVALTLTGRLPRPRPKTSSFEDTSGSPSEVLRILHQNL